MGNTLKSEFELSGVGLHFGVQTNVKVMPAKSGEGRYFIRVDLPEQPRIAAQVAAVGETTLSTELVGQNGKIRGEVRAKVRTVEHLLAALAASGVDDARIEMDGEELPLLDGSAKNWYEAIATVGVTNNSPSLPGVIITEPIWVRADDAFVAALPAPATRFTYGIDFNYEAIGNQWQSWNPAQANFGTEIAPARTFGFAEQIEQLQKAGLIKGGSLDNALVCSHTGWLNPPLRFTNEPARHKLLDLVGDMSLLGQFPTAHIIAYKASHKLHIQLAAQIADGQ